MNLLSTLVEIKWNRQHLDTLISTLGWLVLLFVMRDLNELATNLSETCIQAVVAENIQELLPLPHAPLPPALSVWGCSELSHG